MEVVKFIGQWKTIIFCALRGVICRMRKYFGRNVTDKDAIQSLYDTLDPKSITYSQVWEDPRTLRKALSLGPGDKVIMVCSGGDNALALLMDNPTMILAVDFSPAQVAVGELKRQAIKHLSYELFTYLMGVGEDQDQGMSRIQVYETLLRPELSQDMTTYWDEHKGILAEGLIHQGSYEKYFRTFGKAVRPLAHSFSTIVDFLGCDTDKQKKLFDDVIDSWMWRFVLRRYFGDVLIGRCPTFYERSDVNIAEHFLARIKHVMRNVCVSDNFYLEYVLTGEMTGKFGLPDYLQKANFNTLKERADNLGFVRGDILHILEKSQATFDAIDLSNIFDFVPLSTHHRYRRVVMERASPGCRVVHWTFVPVSDSRLDWSAFGDGSDVDKKLSQNLNGLERAWFYQTFVVQRIAQKAAKQHTNGTVHKNGVNYKNGNIPHKAAVHS